MMKKEIKSFVLHLINCNTKVKKRSPHKNTLKIMLEAVRNWTFCDKQMSKKKLTRKKNHPNKKKMINYKNCKNENIKDNGKRFFYNLKYKRTNES